MSIDKYFNEIKDNKILSKEQEKKATQEQLVLANLKLVGKIAHEYKNMGVDLDDLIQEGNIGLIEAARKFNRNAKNKFNTYASHYIRMKMRNVLNDNRCAVKQSSSQINILNKIRNFIKVYKNKHDNDPSTQEIVDALGISETVVNNALQHKVNGTFSINQKINDDSEDTIEKILNLDNAILSPIEDMIEKDNKQYVKLLLRQLNEKEQQVLIQRFFDDRTLQQIGDKMGLSPAGVKAIQDRALKKLKNIAEN